MTRKEATLFFKKVDHRRLFLNSHFFVCTLSNAIWEIQFCQDLELLSALMHPHIMLKGQGIYFEIILVLIMLLTEFLKILRF